MAIPPVGGRQVRDITRVSSAYRPLARSASSEGAARLMRDTPLGPRPFPRHNTAEVAGGPGTRRDDEYRPD